LDEALRLARLREAAQRDAVLALNDARLLRLQVLKSDLDVIVSASTQATEAFDLAIAPGEPPRLWIDLITGVVMEPDPRTFRLIQDSHGGREVLLETEDRAEMVERIKQHMAHTIIARERRLAARGAQGSTTGGFSWAALGLAWLSGFAIAAFTLLAAANILKIIAF
jgi:hypothetical protein